MTKAKFFDMQCGFWPYQSAVATGSASNSVIYTVTAVPTASALNGLVYSTYGGVQRNDYERGYQVQDHQAGALWDAGNAFLGMNYVYQMPQMPRFQSVLSNIGSLIETPEETVAREKRQAARRAAEVRAEKLLFTILKPAQVKQYSDDGYFDADINGRIYRLHKRSRSMNVELIEAGKAKIKFCAHPHNAHEVPIPDVLLSQFLMLQASEAEFIKIANQQVIQ